jgi:fructuronate reductase
LGLGNFFRAHQAWYTHAAEDDWGYAAFSGRGPNPLIDDLNAQDGCYTLVSRAADGDRFEVIASVARALAGTDHDALLSAFRSPGVAAATITVTEAGYVGGEADVEAQRAGDPPRTAPGRVLAGLAARRRADAGRMAIVSCDNVAGNGEMAQRVVRDLAERVDARLLAWLDEFVSFPTTMVDRITPRTTPADVVADDRCPVVTEPFTEWVISGDFPAGRPRWEAAGATFTDDILPFEHRKLWLLNGAHSLLAYGGSIRGHATVAGATGDDMCRGWVEQWWSEASSHLHQPAEDVAAYRRALLERFSNARMQDRLDRIAMDGSQKLPIRILPVLRAERAQRRMPEGATRVLAAWVCHLRGLGAPVNDARAEEVVPLAGGPLADAVGRVLEWLDPALADDGDVVALVLDQSEQLAAG